MVSLLIDQQMTDQMVERAVQSCAEAKFGGDVPRALQALRQGRCDICAVYSSHLVTQLGNYLGEVDRTVKAVYQYAPYRQRSEGGNGGFTSQSSGINLIAWVERKSAALGALGATLEKVLSQSQKKIGCKKATPVCYTLDVAMVDDQDVQTQSGYGLIVNNPMVHSLNVWQRQGAPDAAVPVPLKSRQPALELEGEFLDPEFTPENLIIERALAIEKLPPQERSAYEHHLMASKVALIRRIISDQQAYQDIAKRWFTIEDLAGIYRRRIGYGRIGGKSAGMLLAARIISEVADPDLRDCIQIPESYFMGSDLIYIFMAMNGLMHWNDQKYKPEEQIRAEYPLIQEQFLAGKFPPEILEELKGLLDKVGNKPLIVRSSSQLEDNFGTSFAGKYNSYFCPNQGSSEQNLKELTEAISRTYASTLKPEALLYRRRKGLQDYDERMAILIQVVQGEAFERYFLPHAAGVAFSRNLYRWSPDIRREDGFARLVWGLGTRAVERLGDDYPRLVALSHPTLQPDGSTEAIRRYSQRYVDVIDLKENALKSLPVHQVLKPHYPPLRLITQVERDGFFITPRMRVPREAVPKLALTFDELLRRTSFATYLSRLLRLLEEHYHDAVDIEFTLHIPDPNNLQPHVKISLLQCRPQSHLAGTRLKHIPDHMPDEDIVFSTCFMVPQGYLPHIRYVVFVSPDAYFALPTPAARREIGRAIAQLNAHLGAKSFICVGPGRWGSANLDLGVFVSYADIHNAGALVELSGRGIGPGPEPSLGTHFFQDLMEAQIYPLAISLDANDAIFCHKFFYRSPNSLLDCLPLDPSIAGVLRLIEVAKVRSGCHLELIMDDEKGQAVALITPDA